MAVKVTLDGIKRRGADWKGRANWQRRKVLIRSGEHKAWWRPKAQGYTSDLGQAGVYFFKDALDLTMSCGPEKKISYHHFSFI